mmetsp:Transcript_5031/g.13550  ORF Transcript_5031/g.13550 Transcript_5031/m.13550 type:complete len:94 (-) Transcript_5031:390-671(-)
MLRVASVTAGRAVRRAACAEGLVATPSARRAVGGEIAAGGMGRKWEDKEHGQEAVYFDKEDRELLRKLAKKANKVRVLSVHRNYDCSRVRFAG